jgi:hypothetical protein
MMFYGHNTGVLFHVASADDGADTIVVDDFYGVASLAVPARIRDYIAPGLDTIAILPAGSESERVRVVVESITESTDTLALPSGTDLSSVIDGDRVVLANQVITDEGTDLDRWMNGLLDLTRNTTVHNINGSTYPDWVAGLDESAQGDVRGSDLYVFFEDLNQRSSFQIEWVYTTIGAIADMGASELDQRRYGSDDNTMRLGFRNLNVMGVSVQSRPYVPAGYMFFGSNSALRKLSPDEGSPETENVVETGEKAGSFQQYTNRLGFYKDQIFRAQLTVVQRLGLGVVSGVTESS